MERKCDLLALDLDGTLLRADKSIAPACVEALSAAAAAGVRIVLASARPPRGTLAFARTLGLTGPQVNYNGALVQRPASLNGDGTFETLLHVPLDRELALQLAHEARAQLPGVRVDVEQLDRWYTDRPDPLGVTETAKLAPPDAVGPLDQLPGEPVTKVMFAAAPDELKGVRERIVGRFGGVINLVQTDAHLLQLTAAGTDKAEALRWLCGREGIARERVGAVGDNMNDAGMLRWAGVGVAVHHATAEARDAADVVMPRAAVVGEDVAEVVARLVW